VNDNGDDNPSKSVWAELYDALIQGLKEPLLVANRTTTAYAVIQRLTSERRDRMNWDARSQLQTGEKHLQLDEAHEDPKRTACVIR